MLKRKLEALEQNSLLPDEVTDAIIDAIANIKQSQQVARQRRLQDKKRVQKQVSPEHVHLEPGMTIYYDLPDDEIKFPSFGLTRVFSRAEANK